MFTIIATHSCPGVCYRIPRRTQAHAHAYAHKHTHTHTPTHTYTCQCSRQVLQYLTSGKPNEAEFRQLIQNASRYCFFFVCITDVLECHATSRTHVHTHPHAFIYVYTLPLSHGFKERSMHAPHMLTSDEVGTMSLIDFCLQ